MTAPRILAGPEFAKASELARPLIEHAGGLAVLYWPIEPGASHDEALRRGQGAIAVQGVMSAMAEDGLPVVDQADILASELGHAIGRLVASGEDYETLMALVAAKVRFVADQIVRMMEPRGSA